MRYALIFDRAVEQPPADIIEAHRGRLIELAAGGRVAMAGPFEGGGGLVVLDVSSAHEAERIAESDPFVLRGTHRFRLVRWLQEIGSDVRQEGAC